MIFLKPIPYLMIRCRITPHIVEILLRQKWVLVSRKTISLSI
jgi:hypothetical protein